MPINVFLSVGRPFSTQQEIFVAAVEKHLARHGLRARTVGRNVAADRRPLELISAVMDRSAGALVIALERIAIEKAVERRGSESETPLAGGICTPWNQIEAALAFSKRLPLLVIREDTVRADGLLEEGHDWLVHATPLKPEFVTSASFAGLFESWHRRVRKKAGWFRYRA